MCDKKMFPCVAVHACMSEMDMQVCLVTRGNTFLSCMQRVTRTLRHFQQSFSTNVGALDLANTSPMRMVG
jgi:hypothetical protein